MSRIFLDSNIILYLLSPDTAKADTAAKAAGASILMTEDMHNGQTLLGIQIQNPFKQSST